MKTLLAVDGSDHSYEGLHSLKYFARAEQVIVLHVLNVPRPAYPMMMPEVADELYRALERSMREDGERLLERVQSLLPLDAGPVTKRLEIGSPADRIVVVAEQECVDLIVMGARGVSPVKERLFGSVSHRIITEAPCAKLLVHGPIQTIKRILLPLQGPDDREAAMRFLQLEPFHEAVDVMVLTVLPTARPPWPVGTSEAEQLEERALQSAREFVEDAAVRIRSLGHQARTRAVLGAPAEAILEESRKLKYNLILMGSRGRRGIKRFLLGSVSHAVVHHMPCPVLVFH